MSGTKRGGRPNVLVFISDDTDFSMLGYGGGDVLTPNIDRIAREGVECTHFHTSASVCTPARYNSLTGHFSGRCPAEGFRNGFPAGEPYAVRWNVNLLPEKEPCIGSALQDAGYTTGYVGKWHCGPNEATLGTDWFEPDDDPADPEVDARLKERQEILCRQVRRNGFDWASSIVWGNTDGRTIRKLRVHNLEHICKGALDFLGRHAGGEEPFFLNVATTTIHGPGHAWSLKQDIRLTGAGYEEDHVGCMPPRETIFERIEAAEGVELNHRSAGALWMDDLVGTVLGRLRELGLEDDTIVIFTTDHGAFDGKATCYQGGVNIPFVMRWPGRVGPRSRCAARFQHIDFMPTVLDACGGRVPDDAVVDGRSVLPWLTGRRQGAFRDELFFEIGYTRAVSTGRWKYIALRPPRRLVEQMKNGEVDMAYDHLGRQGGTLAARRYPHYWEPDQLFDLESDPEEQNNLAGRAEYADVLRQMKERLRRYLETFDGPFDLGEPDEFLTGERYRELTRRNEEFDMNQVEWYRRGWY